MIRIAPEKLKAGMILAKTVYNHQELLLLVKGDSSQNTPRTKTSKAESAASIEAELNQKFADVIDDPVMAAIKQAAVRVLSKSLDAQDEAE
jgi:hypothetical protein